MKLKDSFFQYQACYHCDEIYGYEALLRANIESKICLPIQLLEDIKNDNNAQYYLFNKLFSDIRTSKKLQDARVSINVSCSFISNHIFDMRKINAQGINLTNITIEISERDYFKDKIKTKLNFKRLHELGFKIAIDDFGVEYSTLYRLKELDFDVVKLDKTIIKSDDFKQIKKIIDDIYFINNKVIIVCEGVEKLKELCLLKQLGINYYQGFYFSKPENMMDC
ncbi:EAL domain-containing protein [Photobacterium sp. S4TG1]|uniref:EAL domain-containing protein n=1 Tax=Photobacterium sp. S4TG1 TaxID=3114587 RepID=UPI002E17E377|nr:EAL domain-containing protein [Photobacterium sp. S4TG1]